MGVHTYIYRGNIYIMQVEYGDLLFLVSYVCRGVEIPMKRVPVVRSGQDHVCSLHCVTYPFSTHCLHSCLCIVTTYLSPLSESDLLKSLFSNLSPILMCLRKGEVRWGGVSHGMIEWMSGWMDPAGSGVSCAYIYIYTGQVSCTCTVRVQYSGRREKKKEKKYITTKQEYQKYIK